MRNPTLLPLLLLIPLLAGCGNSAELARSGEIEHVVLCWLKNPGSVSDRAALVAAADSLRTIPGVLEVTAGGPLASDREVVDDSFDVGFVIRVASRESLADYLRHPTHLAAVRNVLAPLAARTVIYDIIVE